MKVPKLLYYIIADAFYRWAMREIRPMHPDVPKIIRRQGEIRDAIARLSASN